MNVLVAYASRLGSTAGIAERIAARLETHDLKATVHPVDSVADVTPYDGVVIGSAVYAGHWLNEASQFIDGHRTALSARPVWLFSSGPVGRLATKFDPVEPAEVGDLKAAVLAQGHRIFPGALDPRTLDGAALGFAERFIAKRFVPKGDFRDWPEIDAWADEIAENLRAAPARRR